VQYFQIDAPLLNNSFRYLTFEIDIQNYPSSEDFWPLLAEEVGSLPELYFTDDNTVQDKADNVDIMGICLLLSSQKSHNCNRLC
jgi:hypothetical protein